jgi:Integrase zinc binding domain
VVQELVNNVSKYKSKDFHGGEKVRSLIFYNNKLVVPKHLHQHAIGWHHFTLCHPGINRTEETISQHLFWPKMRN